MDNVPKALELTLVRADELEELCYTELTKFMEGGGGSIDKMLANLIDACVSDKERFYIGFMMGRIAQISAQSEQGLEPFRKYATDQLNAAEYAQCDHPEVS